MKLVDLKLDRPFQNGMANYLVRIRPDAEKAILPKYLYYCLEFLSSSGRLRTFQHSEMSKIQKNDILNIPLEGNKDYRNLKDLVELLNCDITELKENDIIICVAGTWFGKLLFIDNEILKGGKKK